MGDGSGTLSVFMNHGTKDYYQILGVSEDASKEAIKRSYRKLAKQYHPDKNPGNQVAEGRFNEINEANQVLGNPEKRKQYDMLRQGGFSGGFDPSMFQELFRGGGGPVGGFGSLGGLGGLGTIFESMFGGSDPFRENLRAQRGGGSRRPQEQIADLEIPFLVSARGGKTRLKVQREEICSDCDGSGAATPDDVQTCVACGGQGVVEQSQGSFVTNSRCFGCGGLGKVINRSCESCQRRGRVSKTVTLEVEIPTGIASGQKIRVRGQGRLDPSESKRGDLFIRVSVASHPTFRRRGDDIESDLDLSSEEAQEGTTRTVETLRGPIELAIPPSSENGSLLRARGCGIVRGSKQGDHLFRIRIR